MRRALGILVIIALALRSLVAVGYMPAVAAGDGGVTIVMCTAGGPQLIALDGAGSDRHDSSTHHDEPCAFGCMASVPAPDFEVRFAVAVIPVVLPAHAGEVDLPPARAGPAHGSRAPPFHA